MGVLGALGALPADVDVSVGSVLPEARALKGRLESSTLGASLATLGGAHATHRPSGPVYRWTDAE